MACVVLNNPHNEAQSFYLAAAAAVWGLTVALSRCVMGRHYLSDVVAGILVGVVTVGLVTQVNVKKDS
jgi:membrane-associated phospholipid phosphatase